jgi:hypothetical protein
MNKALPSGSKLLQKRWQIREKEIHKEKLRGIKSSIDSREPVRFRHLYKKAKKDQMMEGEFHPSHST